MSDSSGPRRGDLARDTASIPATDLRGRYTGDLPDQWNFVVPQGGVLMSAAMRAQVAELANPELRVVSATAVFCSPMPAGPFQIDVTTLRRGRAAAQMRSAMSVPGSELGLEVSATYALERTGQPEVLDARFPDVPMPDQAEDLSVPEPSNPHTRWPFFVPLDVRLARGARWWRSDWQAGPARHGRWFRFRVPQRDSRGMLDRLAVPPLCDTMPAALIQFLGPSGARFRAPSLDLTVHWLEDSACDWFLVICYARRARAGYASAEVEVWSEEKRLIAYGTQTMMLRRREEA